MCVCSGSDGVNFNGMFRCLGVACIITVMVIARQGHCHEAKCLQTVDTHSHRYFQHHYTAICSQVDVVTTGCTSVCMCMFSQACRCLSDKLIEPTHSYCAGRWADLLWAQRKSTTPMYTYSYTQMCMHVTLHNVPLATHSSTSFPTPPALAAIQCAATQRAEAIYPFYGWG